MTIKGTAPSGSSLPAGLLELVDEFFPAHGPCGFCGDTILGGRHRVIDAMAEQVRMGIHPDHVAEEFEKPVGAVAVALAAAQEHDIAARREKRWARREGAL